MPVHPPVALMGILNCTPDSFAGPQRWMGVEQQLKLAAAHVAAGASWLDVGGASSRPGAREVGVQEEIDRVLPLLEALQRSAFDARISIDTCRAEVARLALRAGACMVNDISALGDPQMAAVVQAAGAGIVLMHMQGTPQSMQQCPSYADVVREVGAFLAARSAQARAAGIAAAQIYLDPGLGFGKTLAHNLRLVDGLHALASLGQPLCVGASRKAFLGQLCGRAQPTERDPATAALLVAAVLQGARLLRVHDVAAMVDAVRVATALRATAAAQRPEHVDTG